MLNVIIISNGCVHSGHAKQITVQYTGIPETLLALLDAARQRCLVTFESRHKRFNFREDLRVATASLDKLVNEIV